MAELEFVSLPAQGEADDLVARGKFRKWARGPSYRAPPARRNHRLRVARTVRKKHPIGFKVHDVRCGGHCRHDGDAAAHVHQTTQNVLLDAVIVGHHMEARLPPGVLSGQNVARGFIPLIGRLAVTWLARSRPTMLGEALALATSVGPSLLIVEIIPRMAPCLRRWRTSARVSMWEIMGMP